MQEIIAYCGIMCSDCEAYLATLAGDVEALARVAERWNRQYDLAYTADDMWCDGCLDVGGRINSFCADCAIRVCAMGRGMVNCAHCEDYPCDKLHAEPEGKAVLDRIRQELGL